MLLQDSPLLTVPGSDTNVVQDINSGAAKVRLRNVVQIIVADIRNIRNQVKQSDPKKAIEDASIAIASTKNFSGVVRNTPSATNKLQSVLDTVDTLSPIIAPLKTFNSLANGIAEVLGLYLHLLCD